MQALFGVIFSIWLLLEYGWKKVAIGLGVLIVVALALVILAEKDPSKHRRRRRGPSRSMVRISWRIEEETSSTANSRVASDASTSSAPVVKSNRTVTRGIIIREEHLKEILNGQKTWEMRSRPFNGRETIGLIQEGSKSVYAVADVVDCKGPLSRKQLNEAFDRHRIKPAARV